MSTSVDLNFHFCYKGCSKRHVSFAMPWSLLDRQMDKQIYRQSACTLATRKVNTINTSKLYPYHIGTSKQIFRHTSVIILCQLFFYFMDKLCIIRICWCKKGIIYDLQAYSELCSNNVFICFSSQFWAIHYLVGKLAINQPSGVDVLAINLT